MTKVLASVVCSFLVALVATAGGDTKAKIEGTWIMTKAISDGKPKFAEEELKQVMLTAEFKDGKFTLSAEGKVGESGTYKTDAAKKPATIDMVILVGDKFDKGKTQLGIYKIEGDTLTLAVADPGSKTRPKSFDAVKDIEIQTFKRK